MPIKSADPCAIEAPPSFERDEFEATRRRYFDRGDDKTVDRNRWALFAFALLIVVLALVALLVVLLPLKTVEPYIVRVEESGRAVPDPAGTAPFVVEDASVKYFIKEFASKLLTLDAALTQRNLAEAYEATADKAVSEFTEWVAREQPIAQLEKTPALVRTASVQTVSLLPDRVALVRLTTRQRSAARERPLDQRFLVTVKYTLVKPRTADQIFANPVGLFVTHFTVDEETSK